MDNPGEMTTNELRDAISAEDAMTTIQKGFLEVLYELEENLIRGQQEPKFNKQALNIVLRTKKELIQDLDNQD